MRARIIITASTLLLLSGLCTARAEVRHYQFNDVNLSSWAVNDPWQPDGFDEAVILHAPFSEEAPAVDGLADDAAWARAESLTVPLAYGRVREATLKAIHTEKEVFLLASWPDPTRDDQHRPWIWNDERGLYVEGPQVEDSLLVSFEAGCEWTPSLLSGYVYDYDAWRWLAARTDPIGQAVDVSGHAQDRWIPDSGYAKYKARATKPTWQLKFDHARPGMFYMPWEEITRVYMFQPIAEEVYVAWEPDGYRPPAFAKRLAAPEVEPHLLAAPRFLGPRPAYAAPGPSVVPQFQPVTLAGDAGEVAAKGRWADGRWTVEFRRLRVTPARFKTDAVFERVTQLSLHVFDHTERADEAAESGRLFLQFEPAPQPVGN
jgi:hypothetical protein